MSDDFFDGVDESIDSEFSIDTSLDSFIAAPENETVMLPVSKIHPNPKQPRKTWKPGQRESSRASMESEGLINAITVRKHPSIAGEYMIIAGEGRWLNAKDLGWQHISAVIMDVTEYQAHTLSMIENISRDEMSLSHTALGYVSMIELAESEGIKLTSGDLAKTFGKSQGEISKHLKIAGDPELIKLADEHNVKLSVLYSLAQYKALETEDYQTVKQQVITGDIGEKHIDNLKKTVKNSRNGIATESVIATTNESTSNEDDKERVDSNNTEITTETKHKEPRPIKAISYEIADKNVLLSVKGLEQPVSVSKAMLKKLAKELL